jgi:hypothetical protein
VLDDASDADVPLVATELVSSPSAMAAPPSPFDNVFETAATVAAESSPFEFDIPAGSVEIALPNGVLDSLPRVDPPSAAATQSTPHIPTEGERRNTDGLVKEITLPLNLSLEELRQHKKLKVRFILDVNLLP